MCSNASCHQNGGCSKKSFTHGQVPYVKTGANAGSRQPCLHCCVPITKRILTSEGAAPHTPGPLRVHSAAADHLKCAERIASAEAAIFLVGCQSPLVRLLPKPNTAERIFGTYLIGSLMPLYFFDLRDGDDSSWTRREWNLRTLCMPKWKPSQA